MPLIKKHFIIIPNSLTSNQVSPTPTRIVHHNPIRNNSNPYCKIANFAPNHAGQRRFESFGLGSQLAKDLRFFICWCTLLCSRLMLLHFINFARACCVRMTFMIYFDSYKCDNNKLNYVYLLTWVSLSLKAHNEPIIL